MNPLVMGSKTPVSILHEMCMRQGCPPQYDLIVDGGGTHEALFKYRVNAAGVTAVGNGRSKKAAKHDAAKNVLDQLAKCEAESPELTVPEDALDVESPYRDKIQENAVGALQDLCATNGCPQPEYKLLVTEGPAHARKFTFLCSVSKLKETGAGRTKKQAKQLAAYKMLTALKALPNIVDSTLIEKKTDDVCTDGEEGDKSDSTKEVVTKYLDITGGTTKSRVPMGQRLSDYHLSLTYLPEEEIDSILVRRGRISSNAVSEDGSGDEAGEGDDLSLFVELMDKLNMEFAFEEFESHRDPENKLVLLRFSSNTSPVSVIYGMGKSVMDAERVAAKNGLIFLDIMCRKKQKTLDVSSLGP